MSTPNRQPEHLSAAARGLLADSLEQLAGALRDDRAAVFQAETFWAAYAEPNRFRVEATWWPHTETPNSLEPSIDPKTGFQRWGHSDEASD